MGVLFAGSFVLPYMNICGGEERGCTVDRQLEAGAEEEFQGTLVKTERV